MHDRPGFPPDPHRPPIPGWEEIKVEIRKIFAELRDLRADLDKVVAMLAKSTHICDEVRIIEQKTPTTTVLKFKPHTQETRLFAGGRYLFANDTNAEVKIEFFEDNARQQRTKLVSGADFITIPGKGSQPVTIDGSVAAKKEIWVAMSSPQGGSGGGGGADMILDPPIVP